MVTALLALPVAVCLVLGDTGVAISNAVQTLSALVSAVVASAWFARQPGRPAYALAALGCAGWALSNLLWYAAFVFLTADLVPGVADAGFIGFFFFLSAMTAVTHPRPPAGLAGLAVILPVLIILAGTVVLVPAAALTGRPLYYVLIYFVPAAICILEALRLKTTAPVFAAGAALYSLAMTGNAVREAFRFTSPVWFLDGPVVIASFPLVVLGIYALYRGRQA